MVIPSIVRWPLKAIHLPTRITGLSGSIPLLVQRQDHTFAVIDFLVDSGSNVTTIPLSVARKYRLPVPSQVFELTVNTAVGQVRQRVYPGHIRVRIPEFAGREFVWPCHFVEYTGVKPVAVLGLAGVVQDGRIVHDGSYREDALHGCVELQLIERRC